MKSKFILIGAMLLAIATTVLFGNYIKSLDNKYKNDKNLVKVVVLNQDVKKNQKITEEMLEIRSYNPNSVLPEAIKNKKDIIGSYTLIDMKAGEVLFVDRFTNQTKEKQFLTRKISEGMRAVSIGVTYVESVSTIIEPEDYVDVIYSKKNPDESFTTSTILGNVRILAVGERITPKNTTVQADVQNAAQSNVGQIKYSSITLELNPVQAQQITNAELSGELKLVLRSELEKK